jgi:hypothetical protein
VKRSSTPEPPGPPDKVSARSHGFQIIYILILDEIDLTGVEYNAWGLGGGILPSQLDEGD